MHSVGAVDSSAQSRPRMSRPPTHPPTHLSSFQSCSLHSWYVPCTGRPFLSFYRTCTVPLLCLETQTLSIVCQYPTALTAVRAGQARGPGAERCTIQPRCAVGRTIYVSARRLMFPRRQNRLTTCFSECIPVAEHDCVLSEPWEGFKKMSPGEAKFGLSRQ